MANKSIKNKSTRSSSSEQSARLTNAQSKLESALCGISANEMERILADANQAVKPIIKHEAENEIVSEDILSFKMVRF